MSPIAQCAFTPESVRACVRVNGCIFQRHNPYAPQDAILNHSLLLHSYIPIQKDVRIEYFISSCHSGQLTDSKSGHTIWFLSVHNVAQCVLVGWDENYPKRT